MCAAVPPVLGPVPLLSSGIMMSSGLAGTWMVMAARARASACARSAWWGRRSRSSAGTTAMSHRPVGGDPGETAGAVGGCRQSASHLLCGDDENGASCLPDTAANCGGAGPAPRAAAAEYEQVVLEVRQ